MLTTLPHVGLCNVGDGERPLQHNDAFQCTIIVSALCGLELITNPQFSTVMAGVLGGTQVLAILPL